MKKIISFSAVLGMVAPMLAFAEGSPSLDYIIGRIGYLLNFVMPVLIAVAVVYFIWGVIQYTVSTDEEAKKGARAKIIQGLIGLFIIIAFWGIIGIVTSTFGVGPATLDPDYIPCVPNNNVFPPITCN